MDKTLKPLILPRLLICLENVVGRPAIRFCGLLFSILITANWGACMFHFVGLVGNGKTWLQDFELMEEDNVSRFAQTQFNVSLQNTQQNSHITSNYLHYTKTRILLLYLVD